MRRKVETCWRWIEKRLHLIVAAPFLILAFWLIVQSRIGGAALSAAIFLALALLPNVESLKAFGLFEAKLKRADELLEKVAVVAKATADLTYLTVGIGQRMSGPNATQRQKIADAVDAMMRNSTNLTTK